MSVLQGEAAAKEMWSISVAQTGCGTRSRRLLWEGVP